MMAGKLTSFRTSDQTRERLQCAAEVRGCSINQEINDRLDASFAGPDLSERAFANRGLYGLMRVVAVAMRISGRQAMTFKNSGDSEGAELWYRDPYAFDQAITAAVTALDGCRPEGSRAPPEAKDREWAVLYESVGKKFADIVLSEIAQAAPGGRGELLRKDLDPTTIEQILKNRGVSK
jgi:hypothetical protein